MGSRTSSKKNLQKTASSDKKEWQQSTKSTPKRPPVPKFERVVKVVNNVQVLKAKLPKKENSFLQKQIMKSHLKSKSTGGTRNYI